MIKNYLFVFLVLLIALPIMAAEEYKEYKEQHKKDIALAKAVNANDLEKVKKLLDLKADPNTIEDNDFPDTVLNNAVHQGYDQIVLALLQAGADPNKEGKFFNMPLFKAAANGYVEIAKTLLEHKANINATQDAAGISALHVAIMSLDKNNLNMVKLLLECGANVNIRYKHRNSTYSSTPLIYAVRWRNLANTNSKYPINNTEIIKELLQAGASLELQYEGKTAIDFAGDDEIKNLLKKELCRQVRQKRMHWFCMGKRYPASIVYKLPKEIIQLIHKQLKIIEENESNDI